jgi:hypothetical protein
MTRLLPIKAICIEPLVRTSSTMKLSDNSYALVRVHVSVLPCMARKKDAPPDAMRLRRYAIILSLPVGRFFQPGVDLCVCLCSCAAVLV